MFDFDKIIDRRHTNCAKYDLAQAYGYEDDTLPLWAADMDFAAPECVQRALQEAVEHGIFGYTTLDETYVAALQRWFAKRHGWQVEPSWLVTTPGVVFALSAAIRAATEPEAAVLLMPPVYHPFAEAVERNGRQVVECPLVYQAGRYTIDFENMERKIRENRVKLLLLCSPHNPVGRVWSREELQQLGKRCKAYDVAVVSDEIHCDFAFPEHPHTPFPVACPALAERTIVCTSPSKSFNLAGLQISNIFIPGKDLREAFLHQIQITGYDDPSRMGVIACRAAYEEGAAWLDACKAYLQENLSYVRNFLARNIPGIRLVEPQGTYFAWIDCTGLGMTAEELERLFAEKAKIWIDKGSMFGPCPDQFQRIVLACPRSVLEEAMRRLAAALNG